MRKELLQVVYNNGLLWYLLRGVNDCLSDSVDDTSAKKTAEEILSLLPEIHMDETTRAKMETYLHDIIHCETIDAETLLA